MEEYNKYIALVNLRTVLHKKHEVKFNNLLTIPKEEVVTASLKTLRSKIMNAIDDEYLLQLGVLFDCKASDLYSQDEFFWSDWGEDLSSYYFIKGLAQTSTISLKLKEPDRNFRYSRENYRSYFNIINDYYKRLYDLKELYKHFDSGDKTKYFLYIKDVLYDTAITDLCNLFNLINVTRDDLNLSLLDDRASDIKVSKFIFIGGVTAPKI